MDEKQGRVLIVDGMSVLKTTAGGMAYLTNGFAYNFFTQLTATLRKFPDVRHVIVCWEGGYEKRLKVFPGYKDGRKPTSSELKSQRDIVKKLLILVGVDQAVLPGHEADDLAAHLVRDVGLPAVLYTNDTDWLQLIRPGVSVYQKSPYSEGKKNLRVEITLDKFDHYTGYPSPQDYLRGKCLTGDGSDKIPGIYGVGDAIVKSWLVNGPVPPAKLQKIQEFLDSQDYARNMLLIDLISPRSVPEVEWVLGKPDMEAAEAFITEVKWNSIAAKFPEWWETYEKARL